MCRCKDEKNKLMEQKNHLDGLAIAALLVLCVSWGGQQVAIKLIVADISPVMQSAIRSIGATLLVGLWAIFSRESLIERDGTLWWGIVAGLLFTFEFLLVYWGLEFTHASRAVIFLYLAPFVVAIGTQMFIPSERLGPTQFVGLGVAFVGIIIAFSESFTFPSRQMLIGDSMLVCAAIFWGATTMVIKVGPLAKASASKMLFYQLAVSAAVLPIGSWVLNEPGIVNVSSLAIASLLYQMVWIASITYLAWFWLIRHYPAPKLASFTFLTPLFGVLAGWLVLDEPLTAALLVAMVMVAVGIYLVNRKTEIRAVRQIQMPD
jgi:drug/metabolite transporter (DMT)-like permease